MGADAPGPLLFKGWSPDQPRQLPLGAGTAESPCPPPDSALAHDSPLTPVPTRRGEAAPCPCLCHVMESRAGRRPERLLTTRWARSPLDNPGAPTSKAAHPPCWPALPLAAVGVGTVLGESLRTPQGTHRNRSQRKTRRRQHVTAAADFRPGAGRPGPEPQSWALSPAGRYPAGAAGQLSVPQFPYLCCGTTVTRLHVPDGPSPPRPCFPFLQSIHQHAWHSICLWGSSFFPGFLSDPSLQAGSLGAGTPYG